MIRDDIRHLFTLRASPVRWPIGLQAAVSVGVPLATLTLAGHQNLGLMASLGAFVSLYAAAMSRVRRAAVLPIVVVGLLASAGLGVATSQSLVLSLTTLVVVASGAAFLCLGTRIGPPGPIFFVLVAGVSGYLAAPAELHGAGGDPLTVVAMVAVGGVFAYLVVLSPLALPGVRARELARFRDESARSAPRFALDGDGRAILARVAAASAIAVVVSAPLGVDRAYWVVVAVVAILQSVAQLRLTALRAVHRTLGTVLGVGVYAVVALLHPQGLWLTLVVVVLQFTVELLVTRNYGLALAVITPLALIISTYGRGTDAGAVVLERTVDTIIGSVIALAVLAIALLWRQARPADRLE